MAGLLLLRHIDWARGKRQWTSNFVPQSVLVLLVLMALLVNIVMPSRQGFRWAAASRCQGRQSGHTRAWLVLGKEDALRVLLGGRWGRRADTRHVRCSCCVNAETGPHRPVSVTHGRTCLLLCSLYCTQVNADILPLGSLLLPSLLSCLATHWDAGRALEVSKEIILSVVGTWLPGPGVAPFCWSSR